LNFQVWGRIGKTTQFVRGFYPGWDDAYCAELMRAFHLGAGDKIVTPSFGAKTGRAGARDGKIIPSAASRALSTARSRAR
jgi:hypothetical protein